MKTAASRFAAGVVGILMVGVVVSGCAPQPDPPGPPIPPTVAGPIVGGQRGMPLGATAQSVLDHYGYTQAEYFFGGTARSFKAVGALSTDGRWDVTPAGQLPYKTRMLVRRPKDMSTFDGTVYVEWLNVSAGHDADVDFSWAFPMVFSSHAVYVSVSAQRAGVDGGGFSIPSIPGDTSAPLKQWDPERYGTLTIPDDVYSNDIFTQAAQALRSPDGADPLVGKRPTVLIATGQSQSALRMAGYVNAAAKEAGAYDGYLVHSRSNVAVGPNGEYLVNTLLRDDLATPVLQIQTETEVGNGAAAVRQPDTAHYRGWEVAGASHVDRNVTWWGAYASGADPEATVKSITEQCGAINDSQLMYVVRRALSDLDRWARTKDAPASASPMQLDGNQLARDQYGNTKGGVRTPAIDAPVAAYTGVPNSGASNPLLCGFFGSTTPLTKATLQKLYPTHDAYVAAVRKATRADVRAGYIRREDAAEIIHAANAASVP